jgi:hypothetical protein
MYCSSKVTETTVPVLGKQTATRLLTLPARLSTDAAMLMHIGMSFALVATKLTGDGARFQLSAKKMPVRGGLARKEPAGSGTHIGAVQIQADTGHQFINH